VSPHATRPFARVVRDLLEEREWSQRRLANAAGVDPRYLSRALRGTQHPDSTSRHTSRRPWICPRTSSPNAASRA
jgi:transcriptional regulator with XRE-family HTH domain